jgi:hypothetical protein
VPQNLCQIDLLDLVQMCKRLPLVQLLVSAPVASPLLVANIDFAGAALVAHWLEATVWMLGL